LPRRPIAPDIENMVRGPAARHQRQIAKDTRTRNQHQTSHRPLGQSGVRIADRVNRSALQRGRSGAGKERLYPAPETGSQASVVTQKPGGRRIAAADQVLPVPARRTVSQVHATAQSPDGREVFTSAEARTNRSGPIAIKALAELFQSAKILMTISVPDDFPRSNDVIADILQKYKTIAVIGLSSNPRRPSFSVTQYMQSTGYRIIPVNPNETEVLGEKSYPHVEDIPKSLQVEIVDIFRRSEYISPIVDSAIAIGAKVIWMQQGIENHAAAAKARTAGLIAIEDACILIEHRRRR
jgi:predicted CoA-binding protein